ncbi:hypothetical protein BSSX_0260 [Bacillus subtilis]|nr:hypothetical protein BSSX_0260 [Bacillus subtilis]
MWNLLIHPLTLPSFLPSIFTLSSEYKPSNSICLQNQIKALFDYFLKEEQTK